MVASTSATALIVGVTGIVTPVVVIGTSGGWLFGGPGAGVALGSCVVMILVLTVGAHRLARLAFRTATDDVEGEWWPVPAGTVTFLQLSPWPMFDGAPWLWPLMVLAWAGPLLRFPGRVRLVAALVGLTGLGLALAASVRAVLSVA